MKRVVPKIVGNKTSIAIIILSCTCIVLVAFLSPYSSTSASIPFSISSSIFSFSSLLFSL
uniref:Thiosulfate/3-mercaptopyruvate sulfurtransferase 1-like n=1 Tax=Rhizophora mucronata TaxID=61149 RepID=A0A2P2L5V5_RHIMU